MEQLKKFFFCEEVLQVLVCPFTRRERLVGCDRGPANVVGRARDELLNRGRKGRVSGLSGDGRGREESRMDGGRERRGRVGGGSRSTLSI